MKQPFSFSAKFKLITQRYLRHVSLLSPMLYTFSSLAGVYPGEDPSLPLLTGQGVNTITREPLGNCVKFQNFRTASGNETGQIAETWIEELVSVNQLMKYLRLDASAYMDIIIGDDPGLKLGFVNAVNKNSTHRYLLIKSRLGNQLQIGEYPYFTDPIQQYLSAGGSPAGFFSHCGNEFSSTIRTGSEVITVIAFEIRTNDQYRKFSLIGENLRYQQWYGNFDFLYEMKKFQGLAKTKVYMARFGGRGSLPKVENLEEFIKSYPDIIDVSLTDPVSLEIGTRPYGGVDPLNLVPDDTSMRERSFVVAELAAKHADAGEALTTIQYVRANIRDFKYDSKVHDLDAQERAFVNYQRGIESKGRACLNGYWSLCNLPTYDLPDLRLPPRKR